ncbi:MAG: bifunctional metallophosphatase/5'-nucleotidase [Rhodoferax sp.]|uniref:bifunctional metallophosphatase/5'-nucleotidase n=1 Tax=Rhodoferax sp. TaxID=50421 RepID=UPI00271717BD|nr:bifunctional metallophosphatase/5'-nucleotidase [Rhodoferax sp.]MDO8447176.1 bifunctional metallophosphatase/5'-nucleotidase [Rhodoferax sp.]
MKKSLFAALVAAAFVPVVAQADCLTPDTSASVLVGAYDTGVTNRAVSGACTIDDLLNDEQAWGSQQAFLAHASQVSFDLLKQRKITAVERSKLMAGALQSGVGTTLKIKLIGFNDFHGYIKSGEGSSSNPGVARFATKIKELKAVNPLHAVVSAGDMIGASPLTSALFKDEPTIEAMNRIGIDFNAVGNHEFDEGKTELLRMQNGGNHPTDLFSGVGLAADLKAGEFRGAEFKFLAANVLDSDNNTTLFPGVGVKNFLGNKVAFIGMTLESTPTIVSPAGVSGLQFKDEADTANALVPQIKAQGIETIVVLIHEGGFPTITSGSCTGISGAIVDIVNRLDPAIDLVISGHTHQAYSCLINNVAGKPVRVTSAGQYARALSDIDVTIDTRTKDAVAITASNMNVGTSTSAVVQDPSLLEVVNHYVSLSAVPAARVVGTIAATITRAANNAGESALGDVIADAQLAATSSVSTGAALAAFMNPGGIRADLPFAAVGKVNGNVTYGEAFTVQPFGNSLVTLTVTGAQIYAMLEQQWGVAQTFPRILQVSAGFAYTHNFPLPLNVNLTAAEGVQFINSVRGNNYVVPGSVTIGGVPVDMAGSYRITVNSFLADGGDTFTVLTGGTDRLGGEVDTDALEAYLTANPAGVAPGPQNRITRQ